MEFARPTLGYWKIRGMAQAIRYQLAASKVDYDEKFYELGPAPTFDRSVWDAEKSQLGLDFPNIPFIIDGPVKITESSAVHRYCANKWNTDLNGKTLADKALVDMMIPITVDNKQKAVNQCYMQPNKQVAVDAGMASYKVLVDYLGAKHFMIGDYPTIPDFLFLEAIYLLKWLSEDKVLTVYPTLVAYLERMENLEGLKEYLAGPKHITRPFNNGMAQLNN
jgi:glutathione S-transferase